MTAPVRFYLFMKLVFLLSAYLVWLGLCVFASVFQWLTLQVAQVPIKTCKLFAGPTIEIARIK